MPYLMARPNASREDRAETLSFFLLSREMTISKRILEASPEETFFSRRVCKISMKLVRSIAPSASAWTFIASITWSFEHLSNPGSFLTDASNFTTFASSLKSRSGVDGGTSLAASLDDEPAGSMSLFSTARTSRSCNFGRMSSFDTSSSSATSWPRASGGRIPVPRSIPPASCTKQSPSEERTSRVSSADTTTEVLFPPFVRTATNPSSGSTAKPEIPGLICRNTGASVVCDGTDCPMHFLITSSVDSAGTSESLFTLADGLWCAQFRAVLNA
mmetsp:Transcript_41431/g.81193  ORF Transcript_41431/g.81193 Transcript_41431/m.81193 type:complete len:273 (-) Transcript_41431:169-987(-)